MAKRAERPGRPRTVRRASAAALLLVGLLASAASAADPDPDGCAAPDPVREAAFLAFRVEAPKKEAWQDAHGGAIAAKPAVKARLAGWPDALLADRATLPADDAAFLQRLAHDTWQGLEALSDRAHGVPVDHVRFCGGSLAAERVKIGDYTSSTNIGMHLIAIAGALELELLSREEALAQARAVLHSLAALETYHGFFFNYYDTTTLERTSNFVSFVDSAWLTTGLIVTRQTFPELWGECSAWIDRQDYGFFYDPSARLMLHGFTVKRGRAEKSRFHYGTFYTEARIGSLLAIARGAAPESMWYAMRRTLPSRIEWQRQRPLARKREMVRGHASFGGRYAWKNLEYVPSWGGSMFEAMMPVLVLDERTHAPKSLGRNGEIHVEVQRRHASEDLGLPVWGFSPSAQPHSVDYGEFGVPALGVAGYPAKIVTPHAAALALAVAPAEATANLRRLAERFDLYGDFGFYDAVDPKDGTVAHAYLSLDQSMIFVALVNHLRDGVIQKRFAADPLVAPMLPMLAEEDFFD